MENQIGAGLATINKIQTTIDQGARITLDFGSDSHDVIKKLLDIRMGEDCPIMVAFVRVE